ncbi:hypothetical protein R1flu_002949 [Riccia fluitans]|uniref:Beta-mannosidase n=1 Tax=Riccia fluitans TaxID=41844 RepID=A0ABD1YBC5_9MARC
MIDVKLDRGWLAAMSTEVSHTGEELSTTHFPTSAGEPWMEAVVPGTVLATLLKNKRIPDPFYGMDNEKVPDIADVGRAYYTMWFCTSFETPKLKFSCAWLKFQAINYSAHVFVNGSMFSLPGGMFLRHDLNITASVKPSGLNFIAVVVYPPDHPGEVPPEGGQGGNHDIAKDVAAQYVLGWDWMTPIRDRNTGLWDEVTISFTGPVTIKDPHLVTTFYDDFTRSYLQSSAELVNSSSADARCSIKMHVTLDEPDGEEEFCSVENFSQSQVLIKAGASTALTLPQLFFYKPQLWWPNGMGKQPLYNVELTVEVDSNESDHWGHRIGFRKIETWIDKSTRGRKFAVNGKPVFIRGGNWILSDGLLRLSEDRYKTDIGFHADMNMNMIRVWAGGLAERTPFYTACDERGILVWQEFWITGDCNGRGVPPSDQNWPLDHNLFIRCAEDTVKLLRNHPSLALWVGGNEQIPALDIDHALQAELQLNPQFENGGPLLDVDVTKFLDGTRAYIQGSLWSGFADGQGGWSDGPYGIQKPESFFADDYYPYAFNPEIGSVGVPNAETIRATMAPSAWDPPAMEDVGAGYIKDVPNETWEYHKYIPYCDPETKVQNQIVTYGKYTDLDDFCEKAQLANYLQYRALIESWNSRMWEKYTGVLIWKNQNPWPGLRGGLYDFLHDQTGGFFGVRSAAEAIHVQLNLATNVVELVNVTSEEVDDARVEASIWNLDGGRQQQMDFQQLVLPAHKTTKLSEIQFDWANEVCFVLLKLLKGDASLVSRNFYWLHKEGRDYSQLGGDFREKKVPLQVTASSEQKGEQLSITAVVKNGAETHSHSKISRGEGILAGSRVAFFLRFSVLQDTDDKQQVDRRVLPVTYSENYFSLVPGESLTVQISFKPPAGSNRVPVLVLQGWNVDKMEIDYQNAH